jgi:hypothetical protein
MTAGGPISRYPAGLAAPRASSFSWQFRPQTVRAVAERSTEPVRAAPSRLHEKSWESQQGHESSKVSKLALQEQAIRSKLALEVFLKKDRIQTAMN